MSVCLGKILNPIGYILNLVGTFILEYNLLIVNRKLDFFLSAEGKMGAGTEKDSRSSTTVFPSVFWPCCMKGIR